MKVTIDGITYIPEAKEVKPQPVEKPMEFNISVLNGKIYGGALVQDRDWHVYHVTKQECKPMQVRQIMAGDLILTPAMLQDIWSDETTAHTLTSFIDKIRAIRK